MIKAVLFDYGGVVKDAYALRDYIHEICDMKKEETDKTKEKRLEIGSLASKGIITDEEFWKRLSVFIEKPLPENCVEMAKKRYQENFVFIPEIIDFAEKLRMQGVKTVVLSNIFKFEAEVIREKNGYDGFDPVILSYEVGTRKPELDIYKLTIEKLQLKSEECIFIDDKEENLAPAKSLGINVVLAKTPEQIVKDVYFLIEKNRS